MYLPGLWAVAEPGVSAAEPSAGFGSPGLYLYVTATLLPLVSFLALFILGGVRNYRRSLTPDVEIVPDRGPAFIATTAIACSFLLSLIGFIMFAVEHAGGHGDHAEHAAVAHEHKADEHKTEAKTEDTKKTDEHKHDSLGETKTEAHAVPNEHRWADRFEWIRIGSKAKDTRGALALELGYKIDNLTTIMFLMVTFIATLIHVFSMGYMSDELQPIVEDHHVHTADGALKRRGRFGRFFMYLSLFCFSMLNLVLADNLFQIFISWELVGICSFLLIGFYYERQSASNAANKAFITNRVGDAGFVIGLLILWTYVGTFNFDEIFQRVRSPLKDSHGAIPQGGQFVRAEPVSYDARGEIETLAITKPTDPGSEAVLFPLVYHSPHFHGLGYGRDHLQTEIALPADRVLDNYGSIPYWMLVVAGLGIFLGCVGKSAQFPLQVWLPDAMEGPTPVSALIHAATMVAAGVYLVGRTYPLFTAEARLVIAYTGGITLFVAATIAIVMTDIKKVLAYSTVSQLGYMMLALGVGGWTAGLFHLLTHAFFKALLFLGSGSVIYGCHHEQEMGKMGGLFKKMPITALAMLSGVLAIAGTPLFAGWYSKDAVLAAAYGFVSVHSEHMLLFLLPLLTAGITTFYMFRMWFLTFTGTPRDAHVYEHAHETPLPMTVPLIILGVCSLGVAWGWPMWDAEKSYMEHHLEHGQHVSVLADFGVIEEEPYINPAKTDLNSERFLAKAGHSRVGLLALGSAGLGFIFAFVIYQKRVLDPADAVEQFPGVYRFLAHKWYFDEFYSVALVRPTLVVAGWCRWFDATVIDGIAHFLAWFTVWISKWDGIFDHGVIDGLANLLGHVTQTTGRWLHTWQTGYLRSYVLFLVLAAISLFVILRYAAGT